MVTWVKICGLTNLTDVKTVIEHGANAVGFIFAASKRQVEPKKVREIISHIPPEIEKVGVFMNQEAEFVKRTAEFCGLTCLQFHGQESPGYCKEFQDYQVIKAFRVDHTQGWDQISAYIEGAIIDRILLDTYVQGMPGGTGQIFPWYLVHEKHNWGDVPVIIAGGINQSNVSQVITQLNPFGIDVGSGVEVEPGKKEEKKVKELFDKIIGIKAG